MERIYRRQNNRDVNRVYGRARSPDPPQVVVKMRSAGLETSPYPTMLPERKHLNHSPPNWVKDGALFFVTVCCEQRGQNSLCNAKAFEVLLSTLQHYETKGWFYVRLFVAMPDHVHLLITFNPSVEISKSMGCWKSYCARKLDFKWQRGFFDHRIRNSEGAVEKAEYICNNPVRAGLVENIEDWPYFYRGENIWN